MQPMGYAEEGDWAQAARYVAQPFAQTLEELQNRLEHDAAHRHIDAGGLAELINRFRYNPYALRGPDRTLLSHRVFHSDRDKQISALDRARLARCLGFDEQAWQATRRQAFVSGCIVPLSGALGNLLAYGIVPAATLQVLPLVKTGISIAVGVGGLALLAAAFQPFVVAGQEHRRQKHAPSVRPDKTQFNVERTRSQRAVEIKRVAADMDANADAVAATMRRVCTTHGIDFPAGADIQPANRSPDAFMQLAEHIGRVYPNLSQNERNELHGLFDRHLALFHQLCEHQIKIQGTEGKSHREFVARSYQIPTRTLRSVASWFALPVVNKWPIQATTGLTVGLAMLFQGLQMFAAGLDEKFHALPKDANSIILYGDMFNAQGTAQFAAGGPVTVEGIDRAKAMQLMDTRETAFVNRVVSRLTNEITVLERQVQRLHPQQEPGGRSIDDPEVVRKTEELTQMRADLELLRGRNVMGVSANGRAREMLQEGLGEHYLRFALKEGVAKCLTGDFKAQYAERIAQALLLGIGGSAAAAFMPGLMLNLLAPAGNPNVQQRAAALGVATLVALSAATLLYATSVMKAHKRDSNSMGLVGQVGWSMLSPVCEAFNHFKEGSAIDKIQETVIRHVSIIELSAARLMEVASERSQAPGSSGL